MLGRRGSPEILKLFQGVGRASISFGDRGIMRLLLFAKLFQRTRTTEAKMTKPFGVHDDDGANIELRDEKSPNGERRILAYVEGGIEKCSVERHGHTTTITIVSPKGCVYDAGWEVRPLGRRIGRGAVTKPSPG